MLNLYRLISLNKTFILSIIIFFNITILNAKSLSWSFLTQDYSKIIKQKNSTLFLPQFPHSSFISGAREGKRAWKRHYSKISFDLKTDRNFVIILSVNTSLGIKELIYTSGNKETSNYLGLGQYSINNNWNHFSRDISNDLKKLYPNHKLKSINAMVIKGRVSIRDIVFKNEIIDKKSSERIKKLQARIQKMLKALSSKKKKSKPNTPYKKHSIPPKIMLEKDSIVLHKLGKAFIIPKIKAIDVYGTPIDIETIGSVDVNKAGEYPLHFIAIDKSNNVTIKTQLVIVQSDGNQTPISNIATKSNKTIEIVEEDEQENTSDFEMDNKMIMENEYLQRLIANDFEEE